MADLTATDRLMNDNFDLLENYVNKEISRTEFRRKLVENGYSVKDTLEIENFAAALKPNENIFIKENAMSSELLTPELEEIFGIADYVDKLDSKITQTNFSNLNLYIDCVKLYRQTFGKEGLAYLESKVNSLVDKYLYTGEKPDKTGLQELGKLQISITRPMQDKVHGYYNQRDKEPFYISEKEEIAAFTKKSSLEKINDHFEKNSTLNPDGSLRVKNLNELNRELNKGKPFFGDILEFALTHDHLPTDAEIAKMPKQGQTPPLERRNFNSKEKNMSDIGTWEDPGEEARRATNEAIKADFEKEEEQNLSPKQLAIMNSAHQRKVVADAIKAGTLCCLPGQDGYADTATAVNIMSVDKPYHGANLLFLKEHQKQNGFPTAEYITGHQIDVAKKDKPDLFIRQGQKGVSLHVSEKNEETGEWEDKHIRLFNVAQLNKPAVIKEWAAQKREEQTQKNLEYLQAQYGTGYKPPEPKPREPGAEIVCSSTEPEKYLGQYLAAVSMGSKFKASPEQAAEFSEKMVKALYKPMEPRIDQATGAIIPPPLNKETGDPLTDIFSLEKISRDANKVCKEFMRDLKIDAQKQNQPEQKQEQQQSRGGFGM